MTEQEMSYEINRYPFAEFAVRAAPRESGVYLLWEGQELTHIVSAAAIQEKLLEHLQGKISCSCTPTHYGWRLAFDPASLEQRLRDQFAQQHRRPPRCHR